MPVDAVVIHALAEELAPVVTGAKIDKIQQPERDMLILTLRTAAGNKRLLLCGGIGNARAHITEAQYENPVDAPMFCMLMRKHLTGARIRAVEQPGFERMLVFKLDARDEMGDISERRLIVEMMGRSSNIVLVDSEGRITDCIRRMDFGGDAERRMLPGMLYRFPPKQAKLALFEESLDTCLAAIDCFTEERPQDKQLMDAFSGLSPLIARELALGETADGVKPAIAALRAMVEDERFTPYLLSENGVPRELSFTRIAQYGGAMEGESYTSFSALLDAFYTRKDKAAIQKRRSKELSHTVRTARDRIQRKLISQREELKRTEEREEVRKRAELLTANLYRVKKGDRTLICQDYYDEACPEVTIPLDPLKTPQQNSAAMFKEYNKLKTARRYLVSFIEQAEGQLDYLNSVLAELERTETEKDLTDIREELISAGFLKKGRQKNERRVKAQQPYRFVTPAGLEILAGRSNTQNDELTKNARRTDYWFHVQKLHGSHVILKTDGLEPDEESMSIAAGIAAWYSEGRTEGKTAVDYTQVRFVKKPSGSLPGKVLYTDYHTVIASPDLSVIENCKR